MGLTAQEIVEEAEGANNMASFDSIIDDIMETISMVEMVYGVK